MWKGAWETITESPDRFPTKFRQSVSNQFYPQCGATMTEVEQRKENGSLFVRYQCSQNNCDGQWLRKISRNILMVIQEEDADDLV